LATLTPDHYLKYQQAYALFQQGSVEESATVLERILEERDYAPIRNGLAKTYLELGRDDEAHAQFVAMNERIIFNRYANVARKVAAQRGAPLIDLTPEFTVRTTEPLYVDDMHPGEHGQKLIARKIADAFANGLIPKPTRPGG
jgi:lysophospholipase L1-like esterase